MNSKSTNLEKSKSSIKVRTIFQALSLVGTFLIGLRHIMPGESSRGGAFDSFCPLGGIETLLPYLQTGQTLKTTNLLNFALLIGVLGVSLLAGRAFCGWICPVGAAQEFLAGLASRLTRGNKKRRGKTDRLILPIKISQKFDPWLRSLKYLILAIVVLASTWTIYPPLHDICPARAIFSFQLSAPLLISVLVVFIITSMMNRLFWCKYLCPMGAALAIFNKISPMRLVLNQDSCTACGRCDTECPMDIQNVPENLRSAECIQCLECLETCTVHGSIQIQLG